MAVACDDMQLFLLWRIQNTVTDQSDRAVSSFELMMLGKLEPEEIQPIPLKAGSLCPQCQNGRLEYNSLLVLTCPQCGYTGGGGGCT